MSSVSPDQLWYARCEYETVLRKFFEGKTPQELAGFPVELIPGEFVGDYINFCNPKIKGEYEAARRSVLEQRAQSPPKLTKDHPLFVTLEELEHDEGMSLLEIEMEYDKTDDGLGYVPKDHFVGGLPDHRPSPPGSIF